MTSRIGIRGIPFNSSMADKQLAAAMIRLALLDSLRHFIETAERRPKPYVRNLGLSTMGCHSQLEERRLPPILVEMFPHLVELNDTDDIRA